MSHFAVCVSFCIAQYPSHICWPACLLACLPACQFTCLPVYVLACLRACLLACLPDGFPICHSFGCSCLRCAGCAAGISTAYRSLLCLPLCLHSPTVTHPLPASVSAFPDSYTPSACHCVCVPRQLHTPSACLCTCLLSRIRGVEESQRHTRILQDI